MTESAIVEKEFDEGDNEEAAPVREKKRPRRKKKKVKEEKSEKTEDIVAEESARGEALTSGEEPAPKEDIKLQSPDTEEEETELDPIPAPVLTKPSAAFTMPPSPAHEVVSMPEPSENEMSEAQRVAFEAAMAEQQREVEKLMSKPLNPKVAAAKKVVPPPEPRKAIEPSRELAKSPDPIGNNGMIPSSIPEGDEDAAENTTLEGDDDELAGLYEAKGSPTGSAFIGHFSEASSYTLEAVNKCFVVASAGVFCTWLSLLLSVYLLVPAEHFRLATKIEYHTASLGGCLLAVSLLTKCIPVFVRGWKHACSGAMVGALTVQVIAMSTNFLMAIYPMPVLIDPVTHQEQYLLRFCEWTPLSFMMCFLTEGVGLRDVNPGASIWSHVKLPVMLALMQSLSVFQLFMFPLAPNVWIWTLDMIVAMVTWSFMFPRLFFKRDQYLNCPKGKTVDQREAYDRARLSYKLLALCVSIWTILVALYFAAWFVPKLAPPSSFVHRQGLYFVFEASFEVLSKVLYLHVTVDIHSAVFDEGVRASRRLEELRQMMSVVWECSSDVIVISVRGWNGRVTNMLSPTFLRFEGVPESQIRAMVFEQAQEEFTEYVNDHDQSQFQSCACGGLCRPFYCVDFADGQKFFNRDPSFHTAVRHGLESIASLVVKAWTCEQDEFLSIHDIAGPDNRKIQCEGKVTKLDSNALVVVVRDISERFKLFEAEKKAIFETTARTKDAEANRFTRHEVKNGLLAAMALCDSLRDAIQHDGKERTIDSCSSLSNESLAGSAFRLNRPQARRLSNNSQEEFARLRGPQRAVMELDYTLREVLDTVLSEAMARDVIHEVYEPRMERVDIKAVIGSSAYSEMVSRFPVVTYPSPLPIFIFDPQLLKYIHRNAISNACKYGKKGGMVLTEIRFDEGSKELEMNIINSPGEDHDKLLALGEAGMEAVFAPGKRLHNEFSDDGSDDQAFHSSGDGAWISRKCAKTLGGECSIVFEKDRTVFTLRCPAKVFELKKNSTMMDDLSNFALPPNTIGIAIDDSRIQRKLMHKFFSLLKIPIKDQIVSGADSEEILGFNDLVLKQIRSNPQAYYLLIADENLDMVDDTTHHRTVSGSVLIQKLRRDLGEELEGRMLALVRSANDSSVDLAVYMSRAHGFFPKAPIKKDKVIEVLAPMWMRRFPETVVEKKAGNEAPDVEVDIFVSSAADLMQTLDAIDALCYQNEAMLPARWPVIWEKLHGLKGDLKTLNQNMLVTHALDSIEEIRGRTLPPDFLEKWKSTRTIIEAVIKC